MSELHQRRAYLAPDGSLRVALAHQTRVLLRPIQLRTELHQAARPDACAATNAHLSSFMTMPCCAWSCTVHAMHLRLPGEAGARTEYA